MKTRYVCSSCGGDNVTISTSRPSIDERYVVGYCDRCTPVPVYDPKTKRTRPLSRSTVALVRSTDWNPDVLRERAQRKHEQKIVSGALAGKWREGSPELEEYRAIIRRHADEAAARRGTPAA